MKNGYEKIKELQDLINKLSAMKILCNLFIFLIIRC